MPLSSTITELDARNAEPPLRFDVKAPKGAPNVVLVTVDTKPLNLSTADNKAVEQEEVGATIED